MQNESLEYALNKNHLQILDFANYQTKLKITKKTTQWNEIQKWYGFGQTKDGSIAYLFGLRP